MKNEESSHRMAMKKYLSKPETKLKRKVYAEKYRKTPQNKLKMMEYYRTDKYKKMRKKYRQTDRYKELFKIRQKRYLESKRGRETVAKRLKSPEGKKLNKEMQKRYWQSIKGKIAKRNIYLRYSKTQKYRNGIKKRNEKYYKNPLFSLKQGIRNLIRDSFYRNGHRKTSRTINILGCSFIKLKEHLKNNFKKGMSFNNRGFGSDKWHIDHYIPLKYAKTKEEIIKLNHYSNLRPLWQSENFSKSGTLPKDYKEKLKELGFERIE